jgi:hypothetical protein
MSDDGEEVIVMDSIAKLEKLSGVKVWSLSLSLSLSLLLVDAGQLFSFLYLSLLSSMDWLR